MARDLTQSNTMMAPGCKFWKERKDAMGLGDGINGLLNPCESTKKMKNGKQLNKDRVTVITTVTELVCPTPTR